MEKVYSVLFPGNHVLSQKDDQGKEYVMAYASRSLNKAEQNYGITDQECLAVIWARDNCVQFELLAQNSSYFCFVIIVWSCSSNSNTCQNNCKCHSKKTKIQSITIRITKIEHSRRK